MDEIQLIPSVMNSIQDLIDRKSTQFILTGASKTITHTSYYHFALAESFGNF